MQLLCSAFVFTVLISFSHRLHGQDVGHTQPSGPLDSSDGELPPNSSADIPDSIDNMVSDENANEIIREVPVSSLYYLVPDELVAHIVNLTTFLADLREDTVHYVSSTFGRSGEDDHNWTEVSKSLANDYRRNVKSEIELPVIRLLRDAYQDLATANVVNISREISPDEALVDIIDAETVAQEAIEELTELASPTGDGRRRKRSAKAFVDDEGEVDALIELVQYLGRRMPRDIRRSKRDTSSGEHFSRGQTGKSPKVIGPNLRRRMWKAVEEDTVMRRYRAKMRHRLRAILDSIFLKIGDTDIALKYESDETDAANNLLQRVYSRMSRLWPEISSYYTTNNNGGEDFDVRPARRWRRNTGYFMDNLARPVSRSGRGYFNELRLRPARPRGQARYFNDWLASPIIGRRRQRRPNRGGVSPLKVLLKLMKRLTVY